jgi:transmembrane sensor
MAFGSEKRMETRDSRSRQRLTLASEAAAEWLLRLRAGDTSHAVRGEFVDWLRESPVNVAEFLRASQVDVALREFQGWDQLARFEATNVHEISPGDRLPGQVEAPRAVRSAWRWRPWVTSLAAIGAAAAGITLWSGTLAWRTIETGTAERREITLADGTVVDLGPETTLRLRFDERERRIVLKRGDALFQVAKEARRPFLVRAERTSVRAVGTAFGVERRPDSSVVVTVAEGRVAVTRGDGTSLPFIGEPPPLEEIALTAGQQVDVPQTGAMGSVREVDSTRELAWVEGRLIFDDEVLSEVIRQFNRHNVVQIRLQDDALASRTISGVFSSSDPESLIAFLQSAIQVSIVRDGARLIVVQRAAEEPLR